MLAAPPFLRGVRAGAGQFGVCGFQGLEILRPPCLQGLVLHRCLSQCVQFLLLGLRRLAGLRQFPFQAAVPFEPLTVVAVQLQQLVVLGGQGLIGLTQGDLQFLDLVFVPALFLVTLLLDRGSVMFQRLAGMLVPCAALAVAVVLASRAL